MKKKLLVLAATLALVVALVVPAALVSAVTGSVTISGGTLAFTAAAISLAPTTLTGADITATDTTNAWTATDPTGSGAGWHLTVASTNFTSDDVQMVYLTSATSGNFTLTYDGQPTAAIQWNAAASAVETAIEALTNVTAATVTGAGTVGSPWVIRFVTDTGSGIMTSNDALLLPAESTITVTLATIDISVADQQFGITLVNADVGPTAGNTQPVQTSGSLQNIGTSTVSFLTAPTDTGMGSYTLDPDFTLEIRAETYTAAYTATVTVAIVSGP